VVEFEVHHGRPLPTRLNHAIDKLVDKLVETWGGTAWTWNAVSRMLSRQTSSPAASPLHDVQLVQRAL
jgi:hypothetical protein